MACPASAATGLPRQAEDSVAATPALSWDRYRDDGWARMLLNTRRSAPISLICFRSPPVSSLALIWLCGGDWRDFCALPSVAPARPPSVLGFSHGVSAESFST